MWQQGLKRRPWKGKLDQIFFMGLADKRLMSYQPYAIDKRQSLYPAELGVDFTGQSTQENRLCKLGPSTTLKKRYVEKTAPDLIVPDFTVKNSFGVLQDMISGDLPELVNSHLVDLGQAHECSVKSPFTNLGQDQILIAEKHFPDTKSNGLFKSGSWA